MDEQDACMVGPWPTPRHPPASPRRGAGARSRWRALTAAGLQLHGVVARALSDLDRCVDELRGVDRPPRVSLTTYASFASLWLVPRLASFQHANPRIEIRIDASDRPIDLETEGIDVAIR